MKDITQLHARVGEEIGVSPWFEIEQERIDQFARAIVDPQWIHIDPERVKRESPYGGTIAHGFLTLSLLSHLLETTVDVSQMKMGVNYGLNRVRFTDAGTRIALIGQELLPRIAPLLGAGPLARLIVANYGEYADRAFDLAQPDFLKLPPLGADMPEVVPFFHITGIGN